MSNETKTAARRVAKAMGEDLLTIYAKLALLTLVSVVIAYLFFPTYFAIPLILSSQYLLASISLLKAWLVLCGVFTVVKAFEYYSIIKLAGEVTDMIDSDNLK